MNPFLLFFLAMIGVLAIVGILWLDDVLSDWIRGKRD